MEKKNAEAKYDLDKVMLMTLSTLVKDFSPYLPPLLRHRIRVAATRGIKDIRAVQWPTAYACDASYFRRQYQCETFFKRYIFAKDVHTVEELEKLALDGFIASQETFGVRKLSKSTRLVVRRARLIVSDILGDFCQDTWYEHVRPGKNAAIGLPRAKAYLHERFLRLSGTAKQISVWKHMCELDPHLAELLGKSGEPVEVPSELVITAVSKTWKSMRVIAPDTVIGGFLSLGLGGYIRARLEDETHLTFAKGKAIHMQLAQKASRTGRFVTADLSKASDSFVKQHIRMLVPKSWHAALDLCSYERFKVGDKPPLPLRSYMLMGSGFTFPLQTLLFYAIVRSIADLLGLDERCYVYGDDLIYPKAMHPHATKALTELGFTINRDKTFSDVPFRESCGGDYLRGHDVRPFMPEGSVFPATRKGHTCSLYNLLDGLLSRWKWWDIPETVEFLLTEIIATSGVIRIVHPDDAGFSGVRFPDIPLSHLKVNWPTKVAGGRAYTCYTVRPAWEVVPDSLPYLWDALRSANQRPGDDTIFLKGKELHEELLRVCNLESGSQSLRWSREEVVGKGKAHKRNNVVPHVVSRTRPMVVTANRISGDPCWTSVDWYTKHPQRTYMRIGEFALRPLRLRHVLAPKGVVLRFPVRGPVFDVAAAVARIVRVANQH